MRQDGPPLTPQGTYPRSSPGYARQASHSMSQLNLSHSGHSSQRPPGQPGLPYVDPLGVSDRFRNTNVPEMQTPARTSPRNENAFANEAGGQVPLAHEESDWTRGGSSQYSSQQHWQ